MFISLRIGWYLDRIYCGFIVVEKVYFSKIKISMHGKTVCRTFQRDRILNPLDLKPRNVVDLA